MYTSEVQLPGSSINTFIKGLYFSQAFYLQYRWLSPLTHDNSGSPVVVYIHSISAQGLGNSTQMILGESVTD